MDLDLPDELFDDEGKRDEEAAPPASDLEPDSGSEDPENDGALGNDDVPGSDDAPRKKRRKRRPPPKSPAHEARIEEYRALVEDRGWIFSPPTPEKPISSLFDDLTVKQIVTLGKPGRHELERRRA